jgi:hypothetical protein
MQRAIFQPYFNPFAVEGAGASVAKGVAADARRPEPDPDWRPL